MVVCQRLGAWSPCCNFSETHALGPYPTICAETNCPQLCTYLQAQVQLAAMKFDEVISLLGEFGPYQKRIYFLLCLPATTCCMQILVTVFSMAIPPHRCAVPGLDNDTFVIQTPQQKALVNISIPQGDSCYVIESPNILNDTTNVGFVGWTGQGRHVPRSNNSDMKAVPCSRYVYDKSVFTSTIVTQMDLVCEKQYSKSHAQMVTMFGSFLGTLTCQPASDIFGRKKIFLASLAVHALASLATAWSTFFPLLCFFMFINGVAIVSVFSNAFVIGIEFVGPSKRVWTGYVIEIFWSFGMMLLALLAYFLRDWQHLQIAASLLPFAFFSYVWLIPESPRWLLSKGRVQEAEEIIRKAAKVNGVLLPANVLDSASLEIQEHKSVLEIFRHPILLLRCAVIFFNWFVVSLAFYGLGLNVGSLGGSVYINFLLSGLMELVSYVLCLCLLDRLGRRPLNCGLMVLAGLACTLTIFPVLYAPPSHQWVTTALAMIGKLGIGGAFATIWVYSSELFPTVVRNSGMGFSSSCARIGALISPYIANLSTIIGGNTGTAIPLLIFGLPSIVAGLLLLILPETLNRRLPESVDDAVVFGREVVADSPKNGYHLANCEETRLDEEDKL